MLNFSTEAEVRSSELTWLAGTVVALFLAFVLQTAEQLPTGALAAELCSQSELARHTLRLFAAEAVDWGGD